MAERRLNLVLEAIDKASAVIAQLQKAEKELIATLPKEQTIAVKADTSQIDEAVKGASSSLSGLASSGVSGLSSLASGAASFAGSLVKIPFNLLSSGFDLVTSGAQKFFYLIGSIEQVINIVNTLYDKITGVFSAIGSVASSGAAIFKSAIDQTASFEKQMSNAGSVMTATETEMESLRQTALKIGADTSLSAAQAAEGLYNLGSAGFSAADASAALMGAAKLAEATQADLGLASQAVAQNIKAFGLEAGQATTIANLFAAGIGKSALTLPELTDAMKYVAPIAAQSGLQMNEVVAVLGKFADIGIRGSQAGTTLRMSLAQLAGPTDAAKQVLTNLGLTTDQVNPSLNSMQQIISTLGSTGLTTADAIKIFGTEAGPSMMALIAQGAPAIAELQTQITGTEAAFEKSAAQLNNLQGSIMQFQGSVETLQITIGAPFQDAFKAFYDAGTAAVNMLTSFATETGILDAALAPVLIVIDSFMTLVSDLAAAFAPVGAGITSIVASISGFVTAVSEAGLITNVWNTAIDASQAAYTRMESALETLGAGFTGIAQKLGEMTMGLTSSSAAVQIFNGLGAALGAALTSLYAGITNVAKGVSTWIAAHGSLNSILAEFQPVINNLVGAIQPWIDLVIEGAAKITDFGAALGAAQNPVDKFIQCATGISAVLKNLSEGAASAVKEIVAFGAKVIEALSQIDLTKFKFDLGSIIALGLEAAAVVIVAKSVVVLNAIKDVVKSINDSWGTGVSGVLADGLKSGFDALVGIAAELGELLGRIFSDAITWASEKLPGYLAGLNDAIVGWFTGGGLDGVSDGFLGALTAAFDSAKNGLTAAVESLQPAFEAAWNLFVNGILAVISVGLKTIADMISDPAKSPLAGAMQSLAKILSEGVGNAGQNIDFSKLIKAFQDFGNELFNVVDNVLKGSIGTGLKEFLDTFILFGTGFASVVIGIPILSFAKDLTVLAANIPGAITAFKGFYDAILSWGGLSGIIDLVKIGLNSLWAVLSTNPLGIVLLAVAAFGAAWATNFGGIRDALEPFLTAFNTFISDFIDAFDQMVGGSEEAWAGFNTALDVFFADVESAWNGFQTSFGEWLLGIKTAIEEWAAGLWAGAVEMFNVGIETLKMTVQDLLSFFIDFPAQAFEWGYNLASSWVDGVISMIRSAASSIARAAADACASLVGQSPPKTGPLKNIDVWGQNVGDAWASGLTSGIKNSQAEIDRTLAAVTSTASQLAGQIIAPALPAGPAVAGPALAASAAGGNAASASGSAGLTVQINGNISLAPGQSVDDFVNKLGTAVMAAGRRKGF